MSVIAEYWWKQLKESLMGKSETADVKRDKDVHVVYDRTPEDKDDGQDR